MIPADGHATFARLLDSARSFVLTTHVNPDGDAIGSEVGLARYLLSLGKDARVVNPDATPRFLEFLVVSGPRPEVYDPAGHDAVFDGADAIVLLDNSAPDRLGRIEPIARRHAAKSWCIDHHPSKGTLWAQNILEERASATAAMVFLLTRNRGWTPDRASAEALYAGLATDTGFFRFNSTRPEAHEIAAELMRAGAEPARCFREVYERNSPAFTRLLGRALSGLRLDAKGAVASVRITREDVTASDAESVDTSEITTPLLATDGVRVVLLFRELDGGRVKVSLRSKGDLDVHALAAEFGGGGHRNASGIVLQGALDETAERVVARATERLGGAGR